MKKVIEITDEAGFDKVVGEKEKVFLVDFWAPWCGPCRVLTPLLERCVEKKGHENVYLVKVNVDNNKSLAQRFRVRGIPTVLLFSDGVMVDTIVCAVAEKDLDSFVAQALK